MMDVLWIEASVTDANFAPIKTGECSATWEEDGTEKEEVYPIYSYAFEDTRMGDYDMNDVVLKAQETKDGKINLKVVACGATLNLNIRLYPAQGTRAANEVAHYEGTPTNLSYNGQEEVHAMLGARLAGSGQAPLGVIIPKDWSWPTERVCITRAYNETNPVDNSFTTFAGSAGAAESWYNFATGWVMNEETLGY